MPKKPQWSIFRLFLWVFVAALIASHLANFYQRQIVGIAPFSINGPDIEQWLKEIDASVKSHEGALVSPPSDSADSYSFYVYSSKNATSAQLLEQLKSRINEQLDDQSWSIHHAFSFANDSFVFHAYKDGTQLRICGVLAPNTNLSPGAQQCDQLGETITTIKIFQAGFLAR